MYLDTVKELQKWQDEAEHWKSQPTICHTSHNGMGEVSIELCKAIGKVTPRSKKVTKQISQSTLFSSQEFPVSI